MTKQCGKLLIFMDGECSVCRVTSNVLNAADRANCAEVVSFRDDTRYRQHGITDADAAASLQVIDTTSGEIYSGYAAVRRLTREIRLFWPLLPVLWLLAKLGIGEPIYAFVARHRPRFRKSPGTLAPKG